MRAARAQTLVVGRGDDVPGIEQLAAALHEQRVHRRRGERRRATALDTDGAVRVGNHRAPPCRRRPVRHEGEAAGRSRGAVVAGRLVEDAIGRRAGTCPARLLVRDRPRCCMAVAPSASTSAPSAPARRSRRGQRRLVASGSCVPPRNLSPTATCPTPKTVTAIPNRTASTSTLASCQASTSAPTRTFVAPASPWISRSSSRWSAARTSFRIPFARSARPTASVSARVTPGQASAAQPPASQTIPARRVPPRQVPPEERFQRVCIGVGGAT
jgi:hypothetical protein